MNFCFISGRLKLLEFDVFRVAEVDEGVCEDGNGYDDCQNGLANSCWRIKSKDCAGYIRYIEIKGIFAKIEFRHEKLSFRRFAE